MLNKVNEFVSVFTDEDVILYYTSFKCQDGYAVITETEKYLLVDRRYYYAAIKNAKAKVVLIENGSCVDFLLSVGAKTIGLIYSLTSLSFFNELTNKGFAVKDVTFNYVTQSAVKTDSEIDKIAKAQSVAEKSFTETLSVLKEGMTEREVAAYLEYRFSVNGAESKSFDTIIAFNESSSVPHHQTGNSVLTKNSVILMDFGCKVGGYCSDMTRTIAFGEVSAEFKKAYDATLAAHLAAFDGIREGMTGKQADALARNVLNSYELGEYFTHSLGHGVGVKIHENPRLSKTSDEVLKNGNVFSIEPGVYIDGKFGIRIEDTVYLKNGKCVTLNATDKNLITVKP